MILNGTGIQYILAVYFLSLYFPLGQVGLPLWDSFYGLNSRPRDIGERAVHRGCGSIIESIGAGVPDCPRLASSFRFFIANLQLDI